MHITTSVSGILGEEIPMSNPTGPFTSKTPDENLYITGPGTIACFKHLPRSAIRAIFSDPTANRWLTPEGVVWPITDHEMKTLNDPDSAHPFEIVCEQCVTEQHNPQHFPPERILS